MRLRSRGESAGFIAAFTIAILVTPKCGGQGQTPGAPHDVVSNGGSDTDRLPNAPSMTSILDFRKLTDSTARPRNSPPSNLIGLPRKFERDNATQEVGSRLDGIADDAPRRTKHGYDPSDPTKYAQSDADAIGSTNVPMDSWVYPALERLGDLGLIPTQSISVRPWTRQECLRQLTEALDSIDSANSTSGVEAEAERLVSDLQREFANETTADGTFSIESVYMRPGVIIGPALADSYHFGQTWWNDLGRPLGRGGSLITGVSVRSIEHRMFFYGRGEYQHGPGRAAYTPDVNQLISGLDTIGNDNDPTIAPFLGYQAFNRSRAIELYAGIAGSGNSLSFGKQELYWGPTTMGPFAFSSNTEPTYNLRFVSTRPHPFPYFPALGTYRFDIVFGKLSGHRYPARPYYNGQKADFNFGNKLEVSFTRWSILWGSGHPMTLGSLGRSLFSFNSTGTGLYGDRTDPGDRKSDFDFRWHLPFVARAVTLYADAFSDDDPNPIDAPRRAAWSPGIYIARLPGLPHMDFRLEAASSEGLVKDFGGQHFFFNNQYLDANTNKGLILGNAVGRDGRAIEGRLGYWISSRDHIEAAYRQDKDGTAFLPGGGTVSDGSIKISSGIGHHIDVQVFTQYERFLVPSLMANSQHNVGGWLEIIWNPDIRVPLLSRE